MKKFLLSFIFIAMNSISLHGMKQEPGKQLPIVEPIHNSRVPSLVSLADKKLSMLLQQSPYLWKEVNDTIPHDIMPHHINLRYNKTCFRLMQQEFYYKIRSVCQKKLDSYIQIINKMPSYGHNPFIMEQILAKLSSKSKKMELSYPIQFHNNTYIRKDNTKRFLWDLSNQHLLYTTENNTTVIRRPNAECNIDKMIFLGPDSSTEYIISGVSRNIQFCDPRGGNGIYGINSKDSQRILTIKNKYGKEKQYEIPIEKTYRRPTECVYIATDPLCTNLAIFSPFTKPNLILYSGPDLEKIEIKDAGRFYFTSDNKILIQERKGKNKIKLFDLTTLKYSEFGIEEGHFVLIFNHVSNRLAITDLENIYIWNMTTKEKIFEICGFFYSEIEFNKDGTKLSILDAQHNNINVWDIDKKQKIFAKSFDFPIGKLEFIGHNYLGVLVRNGKFLLFNLSNGNCILKYSGISDFCPGNKFVVLEREFSDFVVQFDLYNQELTPLAEQCNNAQVSLLAMAASNNILLKLCTQSDLYKQYQAIPTQLKELLSIEKYVCPSCAELNPKECDNLQ